MRKLLLSLLALLLIGAAALILIRGPRRDWTSDSPEAIAAYDRGLDDLMRYYREDAHREFQRAVELDPAFVAAKIQMLETAMDKAERKRLVAEIEAADRNHLTSRERFLIEYTLAHGDDAARSTVLSRYLEAHGRDPWALFLAAGSAWNRQDWGSAEELYRRLLATDPNWVMAHNHLGYIAMAQGRFEEAEERFRNYAFVAPDQANPHDSLGELLILRGRYAEARTELEAALAVRPDFCASYWNLARLAMLENRPERVDELLPRVEKHCGAEVALEMSCNRTRWVALRKGEFESYWRDLEATCREHQDPADVLSFRLALFAGHREQAEARLGTLRGWIGKSPNPQSGKAMSLTVRVLDLEAIRAAYEGELAAAIAKLREVDALAPYWNDSSGGLLKLANRLLLARLYDRIGDAAAAGKLRVEVAAVNPELAAVESTALIDVPAQ